MCVWATLRLYTCSVDPASIKLTSSIRHRHHPLSLDNHKTLRPNLRRKSATPHCKCGQPTSHTWLTILLYSALSRPSVQQGSCGVAPRSSVMKVHSYHQMIRQLRALLQLRTFVLIVPADFSTRQVTGPLL